MGTAEFWRIISAAAARPAAATLRVGFLSSIRATMPATWGDDIDVPLRKKKLTLLLWLS
jgi:hypothetical protein